MPCFFSQTQERCWIQKLLGRVHWIEGYKGAVAKIGIGQENEGEVYGMDFLYQDWDEQWKSRRTRKRLSGSS